MGDNVIAEQSETPDARGEDTGKDGERNGGHTPLNKPLDTQLNAPLDASPEAPLDTQLDTPLNTSHDAPLEASARNGHSADSGYGTPFYIAKWTALIMFALVLVFLARLVDYPSNPFNFYYPPVALLAGIVAVLVLMAGAYACISGKNKERALFRRNGVLLVLLGCIMLASFFAFKEIIPLLIEGSGS